jgi:hypothetical protein
MLLGLVLGSILLVSGVLALLADYVWSLHLARVWAQISGFLLGTTLIGMSIWAQRLRLWTRAILLGIAVLFLGTVIDSLDGKQDILPVIVLLLTVWAGSFAAETYDLLQLSMYRSRVRRVGLAIGILATVIYLSTAGYYFTLNMIRGPLDYDHHPLYAFGIIIVTLLRHLRTRSESSADRQD